MPTRAVDVKKTLTASTSEEILPENPLRTYAFIQNLGTVAVNLGMGIPAVEGRSPQLVANGGYYEITTINPWHGRVNAISSGTPDVIAVEW